MERGAAALHTRFGGRDGGGETVDRPLRACVATKHDVENRDDAEAGETQRRGMGGG